MYGNTEHVKVDDFIPERLGDKVEILAKSGKGNQNQSKVIKRVKQLYINKKN